MLLITSRRRKRWVVPKGWPSKGRSFPEAAETEAAEEAGLAGIVHEDPVGSYRYRKRMHAGYDVACHVFVYPMVVLEHRLDWPERGERAFKWCSLAEAAELVGDTDLSGLLSKLDGQDTGLLHDVFFGAQAEFV